MSIISSATSALARWRRYYTIPLRPDLQQLEAFSAAEIESRIRAGFARLVISVLVALQIVGFFVAWLNQTPAALLWPQFFGVLYVFFCLVLLLVGRETLASFLYLIGVIAVSTGIGYVSSADVDVRSVLQFVFLIIVIPASGLLLPQWAIWLTTIVDIGTIILVLFLKPLSPGLRLSTGEDPRVLIIGFLSLILISVAVITWLLAQRVFISIESLVQVYRQEQELAALKDQFIIYVNHELRTPMMSLYGNVELLTRLDERATAEKRMNLLRRALRSGDAILKLFSSVLDADVLKPDAIQITTEIIELRPLLLDIVDAFDPHAIGEPGLEAISFTERDVTLDAPPGLFVLADGGRVRQIVINLLTNALKYSFAGSPIVIKAQRVPSPTGYAADEMVQISVRDFGLGVPPAKASQLFQRFVRLERDIASTTRGTGVGLYLSRQLVEAMGGRIWVESRGIEGEGSTFSFTLPTAQP